MMKRKLLVLATMAIAAGNVYANENVGMSISEAEAAFKQNAQSLQISTLSPQEMKSTEGAFGAAPPYQGIPGGLSCYNTLGGRVCN